MENSEEMIAKKRNEFEHLINDVTKSDFGQIISTIADSIGKVFKTYKDRNEIIMTERISIFLDYFKGYEGIINELRNNNYALKNFMDKEGISIENLDGMSIKSFSDDSIELIQGNSLYSVIVTYSYNIEYIEPKQEDYPLTQNRWKITIDSPEIEYDNEDLDNEELDTVIPYRPESFSELMKINAFIIEEECKDYLETHKWQVNTPYTLKDEHDDIDEYCWGSER